MARIITPANAIACATVLVKAARVLKIDDIVSVHRNEKRKKMKN